MVEDNKRKKVGFTDIAESFIDKNNKKYINPGEN